MFYLLDTNACIMQFRGKTQLIQQRIFSTGIQNVRLCSIVMAELYAGVPRSNDPIAARQLIEQFAGQFISLPFDDDVADTYGEIHAHLAMRGAMIGAADLMIASVALTHSLTVVTNNTNEFQRVPNLQLVDWSIPTPTP